MASKKPPTEEEILNYFKGLTRQQQRRLVTKLVENFHPVTYALRCVNKVDFLGRALLYCKKYDIPYDIKVGEKHSRLIFNTPEHRNQVFNGMWTIGGAE